MKKEWDIRPLKEADCEKLIKLINFVQPHVPYSEERFRWEYLDCPHGQALVWLCEQDDEIIGVAGHAPHKWYINGVEKRLYLNVDAMTHPDFRLRGIHASLEKKTRENTLNSGALMSYVFPNDQSVRQTRKSNYCQVTQIPLFVKKINGRIEKESTPPQYQLEEVTSFGLEVNVLQRNVSSIYSIIHKRDSDYLNWRFPQKPDDQYRIFYVLSSGTFLGYMVFKHFQQKGETPQTHIIDMLVEPENERAAELLIHKSIDLSVEAGVDYLTCWLSHQKPWGKILQKFGFRETDIDRYLFIFKGDSSGTAENLTIPANWYLTMGDSDVF